VDETKLKPLLKTNHVFRADCIRAPEGFVEVFAVPATEFGGAVIDVFEWTTAFEDAFELAKVADIAAGVKRKFDVGAEAEADLVGLMMKITGDDVMTALAKLFDEAGADCAETACY
jgi:hypothetical protein